jgi:hypothetical protein
MLRILFSIFHIGSFLYLVSFGGKNNFWDPQKRMSSDADDITQSFATLSSFVVHLFHRDKRCIEDIPKQDELPSHFHSNPTIYEK